MPVRDLAEIEAGIARFARESGGALLVPPDPFTVGHRKTTVSELNKKIYGTIEASRNRPIEREHPSVYLDQPPMRFYTSYRKVYDPTSRTDLLRICPSWCRSDWEPTRRPPGPRSPHR
jgi:hypothetical protein